MAVSLVREVVVTLACVAIGFVAVFALTFVAGLYGFGGAS